MIGAHSCSRFSNHSRATASNELAARQMTCRLASFFASAGSLPAASTLACLCPPVAGVGQTDVRVHAQCQQLFLAGEEVSQPPVFAAGRLDQKKQAFAVGDLVRLGSGLGIANFGIRETVGMGYISP